MPLPHQILSESFRVLNLVDYPNYSAILPATDNDHKESYIVAGVRRECQGLHRIHDVHVNLNAFLLWQKSIKLFNFAWQN